MRILILISAIFLSLPAFAAKWQIIPNQSKIEFIANQNGNKISGSFAKFSGDIFFDKADLKNSKVDIAIDLNSLTTSLNGASETLAQKDWFFTAKFPQARFTSDKFSKISDNKFRSDGFLQIKDHKIPTSFEFSFDEYSDKKAKASGSLKLSRSAFDIGNKNEKLAHDVKDEVEVKISVTAFAK
jgi:cytochrome b561